MIELILVVIMIVALFAEEFVAAILTIFGLALYSSHKTLKQRFNFLHQEFQQLKKDFSEHRQSSSLTETEPTVTQEEMTEKKPTYKASTTESATVETTDQQITPKTPEEKPQKPALSSPSKVDPWQQPEESAQTISPAQLKTETLAASIAITEDQEAKTVRQNKVDKQVVKQAVNQSGDKDLIKTIEQFVFQGNLTVKAGLVILFFGLGFLLKYAADNSLLSIEFRLTMVTLFGFALLALGWKLKQKNPRYALILQGGSVGVLYLTTYSAFKLYHIIPNELGFILLLAVMALSIALALKQDSRELAFIGAFGGFIAPIIASTGSGSHIVLFSYYAVLNLSIFAIAWFKSWRELNLLGFYMTFLVGLAWGADRYRSTNYAETQFFLTLFFVMYVAISALHALKQPPKLKGMVDGTLLFGPPIIGFTFQTVLMQPYEYGSAYSSAALGVFYLALGLVLRNRLETEFKTLYQTFFALSLIFFTLMIPLAFDNNWSSAAWAIEGAGIIWISSKQGRKFPLYFGLLILIGASMLYPIEHFAGLYSNGSFMTNAEYFGALIISASALLSAFFLNRYRTINSHIPSEVSPLLLIWGGIWWFSSIWREFNTHLAEDQMATAMLLHLALSAILFSWLEIRYRWQDLKYARLVWLLILVFITFSSIEEQGHLFKHYAIVAWGLNAYLFYRLLYQIEAKNPLNLNLEASQSHQSTLYGPKLLSILHGLAFVLFVFIAGFEAQWEITQYSEQARYDSLIGAASLSANEIQWGVSESYSNWMDETLLGFAVILVLAFALIVEVKKWPFSTHADLYLKRIGVPIAVLLLLWNLSFNLMSEGGSIWLVYLPVLSVLDMLSLLSLGLIYRWWMQVANKSDNPNSQTTFYYVAGITVFLIANAIILRTLFHWFGIDYELESWLKSTLTQTTLAIFWSLLAFVVMYLAHKKQNRGLWVAGSVLMVMVVLKVFTLDLANSGTIERIISFLGVGGLLMIIGYYFPIPPQKKSSVDQHRDSAN